MDPLLILLLVGLGGLLWVLNRGSASPTAGRRTITLGAAVVCRLTTEEQRRRANDRNLTYQRIEEQARMSGEIGPELFGRRIAAISSLPQAIRQGPPGMAEF